MTPQPPAQAADSSRIRAAAAALDCPTELLPVALAAFTGAPEPAPGAARSLLEAAFAAVDRVPRHEIGTGDLTAAAQDWPALSVTVPATPWQAATLVDRLVDLLRPLTAGRLREVAAGLGVEAGDLVRRLHAADDPSVAEEREKPAGRAGRTMREALAAGPDPVAGLRVWTMAVPGLAAGDPATWPRVFEDALRGAVLEVLARAADGLLRISRLDPAPAEWSAGGEGLTACRPVPGSPHGLQARLMPAPAQRPLLPGWDRPVWPADTSSGAPRGSAWRWEVGWPLPDGTFQAQAGYSVTEPSRAMAKFAAEQTLAELLPAAPGLRQSFTGRLLIPRSRPPAGDDPALRVITLRSLLRGVSRAGGDDDDEGPTRAQAWQRIVEGISLPAPRPPEPAAADDRALAQLLDFLAVQAVVLSPPALRYLAGVDHRAGPLAMDRRHARGLRRAMEPATAEEAGQLAADLGPLLPGTAWTDLLDAAGLERFLNAEP
ncbi:hypothetical protein ACFV9E_18340 [Streptomyces sp. NPDC059835]|uniref:hypothetical protein n=1 Tax=Streptomyces sp. NPDC059835 TaxID=3346967 RepID=UPI00364DD3A9